jgi:hypothetical protein
VIHFFCGLEFERGREGWEVMIMMIMMEFCHFARVVWHYF